MASELDEMVVGFRNRRLDDAPYVFLWLDALTQKVREGGRIVNVHALIATGVSAEGKREILGIEVTSSEDGAGWLALLRGLVARGLSGVQLVTSDCHRRHNADRQPTRIAVRIQRLTRRHDRSPISMFITQDPTSTAG